MSQNPNFEHGEINLSDLIAALWSHKLLITLFTGLSIFFAGYYALTTQKKFTAQAIFQIEEVNSNSGFNLSGDLGTIASLAGLAKGNNKSSLGILLERANGREFIIMMKENSSLDLDPFFNTYDPNYKDPVWKATIKKIIGWQKTEQEKKAIIETNITNNYRKNVAFEATNNGAISISVTHTDPHKASKYANKLMEEMRQLVENESTSAQERRLNYLSEILADALQDMELAEENLKDYALKNSALAQENFISDSLKLDQIRMEKRKVTEIADLLSIIENLIKSGNLDNSSHDILRSSYPLVDDIEFRRILGMSETISAWTWPQIETIEAVNATLRDRIKRLEVDINNIKENAKIYATSAEDLAKFTRDSKIAEATYTVLIEQVKSQYLAAGFQPETFKVFEYATPPMVPSSPRRNVVLALGAVLGMFTGCAFAVIYATLRGVYYTRTTLISDASAELALKSKPIRRLSRKSISAIISLLSKRQIIALDEAALKLSTKKIIYILNSGGQPTSSNAARILAAQSAQSGRNVILCDTTNHLDKEIEEKSKTQNSDFPIVSIANNISVMAETEGASFFTSTDLNSRIKDLTERFDQVFVCSSNRNAKLGLMALSEFTTGLVVIAGLRKTRKFDIQNIKTKQPIDLLFYD